MTAATKPFIKKKTVGFYGGNAHAFNIDPRTGKVDITYPEDLREQIGAVLAHLINKKGINCFISAFINRFETECGNACIDLRPEYEIKLIGLDTITPLNIDLDNTQNYYQLWNKLDCSHTLFNVNDLRTIYVKFLLDNCNTLITYAIDDNYHLELFRKKAANKGVRVINLRMF